MGFLGINDWGDAANAATVAGTIAAVLLGILAVRQYLRDSFLHQDSIANEKLNEIYRLALAEPDLAEGEYDPDALGCDDPERVCAARKYLWFYSAMLAHLEYLYLYGRHRSEWLSTIRLSISPHLAFIGSDYHRNEGWWDTYSPEFRKFLREELLAWQAAKRAGRGNG